MKWFLREIVKTYYRIGPRFSIVGIEASLTPENLASLGCSLSRKCIVQPNESIAKELLSPRIVGDTRRDLFAGMHEQCG